MITINVDKRGCGYYSLTVEDHGQAYVQIIGASEEDTLPVLKAVLAQLEDENR